MRDDAPAPLPDQLKVAVAVRAALIDTVQVRADPEHAPDHPVKLVPGAGVAVSCTRVPETNRPRQRVSEVPERAVAHDNPAGEEVT